MNPYGAQLRSLLLRHGYKFKRGFSKFSKDSSLLVHLKFRRVQNAFDDSEKPGFAMSLEVSYPMGDSFIQVSPHEIADFRRDGTLRRVNFTNEIEGIFGQDEEDVVVGLLSDWLEFWEGKIADPHSALEIASAFRGRAPFPPYLSYLQSQVPRNEEQKLEFQLSRRPLIWPFDGGINLLSSIAYLNAGGRFGDARELVLAALDESYFQNIRHASVVLDEPLQKLLDDAKCETVRLSDENFSTLRNLGHID